MFQPFAQINYLAVLVSAIAYFMLGALWYAPQFLGNAWMKTRNITPKDIQGGLTPRLFVITFLCELIAALVVGYVVTAANVSGIGSGLVVGLLLGLGFVATSIGVTFLYENRPLNLFLIDAGYPVAPPPAPRQPLSLPNRYVDSQ